MLNITNYVTPQSIDEAYEYLQKNKSNRIIGGMLWLKMMDLNIHTAIDLSACHLEQIEENETEIKIGAMVSLRTLETNACINNYYNGVLSSAVKDIVGVQFRNLATIGGSVYSRFGFSDILCVLMALPCDVVLHHGGRMSIQEFSEMGYERDIITHIILKKEAGKGSYLTIRNSATDLPALAVCVTKDHAWHISVGARPKKAVSINIDVMNEENLDDVCEKIASEVKLESNARASETYRKKVLPVLMKRAMKEVLGC